MQITFCILHSAFCIRLESRAMKKFTVLALILFACSPHEDSRLNPAATFGLRTI